MSVRKITVDELLVTPFSLRTEDEKSRIIEDGRPTPLVMALSTLLPKETTPQGKLTVYDELKFRHQKLFDLAKSLYDDISWLTASLTTQNFYCWQCILFQFQNPGEWNVEGISDVSKVREAAEEHKLTVEHVEAMHQYQTFCDANAKKKLLVECSIVSIDVIKRLTDVVCTLASTHLPPKKLNNCLSELDIKHCINSLQLLQKYDKLRKYSSDEAIDLLQNNPRIIVNLKMAIAKAMRQTVARKMDSCKYVSIILNQHSNVKLKAQISTVLRYVANGKVREKFVEFSHFFQIATVRNLYTHIMRIASEFNIESKCIALSLDGGILHHSDIEKLVQPCQNKLRRCILVPCYSHTVNEVLQKSLSSSHVKFGSFFKIMADFNACFWNQNSEFRAAFDIFATGSKNNDLKISPRINSSDWFASTNFICCVHKHRRYFMSFLEEAVSSDSKLIADDITKAIRFREYLSDLVTVFLLAFFSDIFCATSALNTALAVHWPERIINDQIVYNLLRSLSAMEVGDFERLFAEAVKESGALNPGVERAKCSSMFTKALKVVTGEVKARYSDVHKFKFCSLFDFESGGWFEETANRYKNLARVYKPPYDLPQTLCEMELLSKHGAFSKRSVYDFYQYLHESNFSQAFAALFEFSELILALPLKPSAKKVSIKDKIEEWSFGSADKRYSEDVSVVFVESKSLQGMKRDPVFYDKVLENMIFYLNPSQQAGGSRRMQLLSPEADLEGV